MGSHVRGNARGRARSRIGRTLIAKRPEYAAACTFSITFLRHHAPSMLGSLPLASPSLQLVSLDVIT